MAAQQNLFTFEAEPWEADDRRDRLIATVVFPAGVEQPFDYEVPEPLRASIKIGQRVEVPLGRGNRPTVGYCVKLAPNTTSQHKLKSVGRIIDERPLLTPAMLNLTRWMADHYLCTWGTTLQTVLPAAVRAKQTLREITQVTLHPQVHQRLAASQPPKITPKQQAVLAYLTKNPATISLADLARQCECTPGPIQSLAKKGLIKLTKRFVGEGVGVEADTPSEAQLKLNQDQTRALAAIIDPMRAGEHATILIHGVTGSGKTEVYMQAIDETLSFGRQAIMLVPEISLTPQTRERFQARFAQVAVLHSHLRDAERLWHWERIARGEVSVIVGARSAVFAPCSRLGLIILDEEHEGSFKQSETPRYHARDVALWRAREESVPLVLGSATPAIESWHRAQSGQAVLCELPRRVSNRPLPDVLTVDMRDARQVRGALSRQLQNAMKQTLADRGQIILLLNRRGYSTHIQCPGCGFVVRCPDCELPLTHHRTGEIAVCHYCDHSERAPAACPQCKLPGLRYSGMGTQRLEAEVKASFPEARVLRMDTDTMKQPDSHARAFEAFSKHEVDILLGTQMIAKGLDFPNVLLVGVVNADTALHLPDFRAAERTFQLVTQVAGRTGRGERGGRVLVQTLNPDHYAIQAASRHDYAQFAAQEMPLREGGHFPPIWPLARVIVRGPNEQVAQATAQTLADQVRKNLEQLTPDLRLLGPAAAPMPKLRNLYRFHFLAQAADEGHLRTALRQAQLSAAPPEEVQWVVDIDPQEML
ncbi:MAG: primosomal protein N' [Pirellulales bacterium]|nr:primosomal protein N' [Pirellulales bacterium]